MEADFSPLCSCISCLKLVFFGSMSIVQAAFLGFLQGITEFLPVSSSGHLLVMRDMLGIKGIPLIFDISLHLATLLAIVIVFRELLIRLIRALFAYVRKSASGEQRKDVRLILMVLFSSLCTVIVVLLIGNVIEGMPIQAVYGMFLVTAALLITAKFFSGNTAFREISARQSAAVGIAQGFGAIPGISRSGSTIAVSLISGIDRKTAGEYSFLISIPAVVGAFLYELMRSGNSGSGSAAQQIDAAVIAAGMITAFAAGYICLKLLLKMIRSGKLYLFSIYLVPLALYGLFFS